MAYLVTNDYINKIYSQDDRNDLKIWFNDVELSDAGRKCEKITRIARVLPDDGSQRFSLDNFFSTNLEVILHDVDIDDIQDQVKISIGTLVSGNTYEYVPLGIFNIQDKPENDKNKITLKLRDNRIKFDFNYNAQPLIERLGGQATKMQILNDICSIAGVTNTISSFNGDSDLVGIYDSSIQATTYVAYLMEQAGLIPVIDRLGSLAKVDLSNLYTWRIPLSVLENDYKIGQSYQINRVCYESGIIKYETSNDETLDTLYINSANPYITSQPQVYYIYNKLKNFKIDSVLTKQVLGNPAIDPYDLIQVYNDLDGSNDIVFTTLANTTYVFNGVHRDTFDTQIGIEKRKENVSKNSEQAYRKYAKTEIDNLNARIELIASETKIMSNEVFGTGTLTLVNAYEGTLHRLEITGNISCLVASNDVTVSNNLTPNDTYLIVDNETKYKLDFTHLSYISEYVHDTYVYEDGKQWVERANGTIEESDKEILIKVKNNSTLQMESFDNCVIKAKYLLQNDYTNSFTNTLDIISQINLTPGEASILANKIKLEGYTTINNNFGVDLEGNMFAKNGSFSGNIYLENGNKVIGGDGLLSNLQYVSQGNLDNGFTPLGFEEVGYYNVYKYADVKVDVYIPKDFTVTEAYLTLYTSGIQVFDSSNANVGVGICKNLKLYKGYADYVNEYYVAPSAGYMQSASEISGTEIVNAFNNSATYTPPATTNEATMITTKNIAEELKEGRNIIFVRTSLNKPNYTPQSFNTEPYMNSGIAKAVIDIIGYKSYNKNA